MNLVVTLLVGMPSIRPTDSLSLHGCGEGATSIRGRIFGGKLSRPGMWPWQVGIHKQNIIDSSRYNIICGGALIAPQWVLTAAHCFYTRRTSRSKIWHEEDTTSLKRYKIIAGDIDTQIREISEQERFPIEVYIHPGFRHDPYFDNDIAMVKLNQTVTLSSLVRTVCLPISNVDLSKPGTVGTVAGWGRTRKSWISTVLTHTTIAIKDNAICKQATTYFFNKTVTFCAGDGNGRNDTCQGDSGGSLVRSVSVNNQRRWVAVGLVSWGEGCGLPGKYGYYTRIHSFVDWIKGTINSSMNGGYSRWSSWSHCTKTCGGGAKQRSRSCNNPRPQNGGKDCRGLGQDKESQKCNTNACSVNGGYSRWSSWSYCTKTCGGGAKQRSRSCNNPKPQNGGNDCRGLGQDKESQKCNTNACSDCVDDDNKWCKTNKNYCSYKNVRKWCPYTCGTCAGSRVNGGYSSWSRWFYCNKKCGGGTRQRVRFCNNPMPQNGGKNCRGLGRSWEERYCNTNACPGA